MSKRVVVATRNADKVVELARLLAMPSIDLIAVQALDPSMPDVVEDAASYEGNALKKAREVALRTRSIALGDDSGLEVDALGGAPGIHSARYSGLGARANVDKLLGALESIDETRRTARFRCVLALVDPRDVGHPLVARGTCEGAIGHVPRGDHGFGYDPIFVPRGETRTMAELAEREKDAISHRGDACRALVSALDPWLRART